MANTKEERIYIRVSGKIRDDFDKVAEHRGLTRSGLLHSLIVNTIHLAKKEVPEIFVKDPKPSSEKIVPMMTLDEAKADDKNKKAKVEKRK